MTMTYESRMLIDGKLVEAFGGATYDNINPATEAVIGPVADADAADMESAITAARRAFDETSWSTDRAFRRTCLVQLKDALASHREDLRPTLCQSAIQLRKAHVVPVELRLVDAQK